jgi:hypothetical protein
LSTGVKLCFVEESLDPFPQCLGYFSFPSTVHQSEWK